MAKARKKSQKISIKTSKSKDYTYNILLFSIKCNKKMGTMFSSFLFEVKY